MRAEAATAGGRTRGRSRRPKRVAPGVLRASPRWTAGVAEAAAGAVPSDATVALLALADGTTVAGGGATARDGGALPEEVAPAVTPLRFPMVTTIPPIPPITTRAPMTSATPRPDPRRTLARKAAGPVAERSVPALP